MADRPVVAIAGFGPGLGAALAARFAKEGYAVGALCRNPPAAGPQLIPVACDVTDAESVARAFDELDKAGPLRVLVYNVAALIRGPFGSTTAGEFELAWRTAALGAFLCTQRALPGLLATKQGSILFTGATASLRGGPGFCAFASAKFALRALAQSLARELGPQGIHVAHVVIDGLIWSERTRQRFDPARESCLEPEAVAESYWNLATQAPSAWTHELDLRPHVEKH